MCFSCQKKRVWHMISNRMTDQPVKFDSSEVQELRKKFDKVAGHNKTINTEAFKKNMGILGLRSAHEFSDRLFNSFDIDNDGCISFQDFLEYMEVLKCGSDKNRAKISFKLIDYKNKNYITMDDFRAFLNDFFMSWSSITNVSISIEIKDRTNQYIHLIFNKVKKQRKVSEIDFKYYYQKLYKDKQFIEAFDFITEGVAKIFIPENSNNLVNSHSNILYKVLKELNKINNTVFQMSKKESSLLKEVFSEELPKQIPQFLINIPKNMNIPKSKQKQFQQDKTKKNQNQNINNNQQSNGQIFKEIKDLFQEKQKSKKTAIKEELENLMKNRQTWTNSYSKLHFNDKQLDNSSNNLISLYEKKLLFLKNKIQNIVDETQTVYNNLIDKFENIKNDNYPNQYQKGINVHKNMKKNSDSSVSKMVFFGDDNWNMVLNMMIGIQMAVRSVRGYQEVMYEQPKDFALKYYFELVPRRFGGQHYQSTIYSFTDYAPNTFNRIRKIFQIDNQEYINSIGPNRLMTSLLMGEVSSMTSLTSQGKSGSFFYYTADNKYMLKTIQLRQYVFIKKILQDYYFYIKDNPKTLISKFFGLHKLIEKDQYGSTIGKSYFVIMANVFNTKDKIVERYDIKGSSYGRQNEDTDPKATKKDNDFRKRKPLIIDKQECQQLIEIMNKDKEFFRQHDIIDYSLLIGVIKDNNLRNSENNQNYNAKIYHSAVQNEKYIFGIIDYLTEYSSRKVMEYYFKRVFYGQGISAVPPNDYAQRFIKFIEFEVFEQKAPDQIQKSK